jgi:hypothetical protein
VTGRRITAQARPDLVTYLRAEGADHTQVGNASPQAYRDALKAFLEQCYEVPDPATGDEPPEPNP